MSQAKVDKRKYEKKNRKEIERKRKIKTTVKCVVWSLAIGTIIGVPTGIKFYKEMPKFVGDSSLGAFVANYIDENYSEDIKVLDTQDATTEDEIKDAIEQAVGEDLEEVDKGELEEAVDEKEEE